MLLLRPIHFRPVYFQLMFFAQGDTRILDTRDEHLREVEDDVFYRASFFHSRNILTFLRILECSDFVFFRIGCAYRFPGHDALSVNFVTKDFPGAKFQRAYSLVAQFFQVFHERTQRITVRDNQHVFPRGEFRQDVPGVVRHYTVVDIFHRLAALDGMIPTAPDALELFVANLFFHFPLVLARMNAVAAFVERGVALRLVREPERRLYFMPCLVRSLEHRDVHAVHADIFDGLTRAARFFETFFREIHIRLPRPFAELVPLRDAVSDQNEVCHTNSS